VAVYRLAVAYRQTEIGDVIEDALDEPLDEIAEVTDE